MNPKPAAMAVAISLQSLFIGACSIGVETHEFKPAQGPQGVQTELVLNKNIVDGNRIEGELLAVRADGLILNVPYPPETRQPDRLVLVPFWMMKTARLEQMGSAKIQSRGREQDEKALDRLRLVARFPQGLSDDLLARLLAESGQAELEVPENQE